MRLFLFPSLLLLAACSGDKATDSADTAVDSGLDSAVDTDSGTDTSVDTGTDTSIDTDSGQVVDGDGDGASADVDCDDADATSFPGNVEVCDERDNDCNGIVDDDASDATTYYTDADRDGYGDDAVGVAACVQPPDSVTVGGDCNDADAAYHPSADEADCTDPNDYNCDGSVGYADSDGDGVAACTECNDADAAVFPGAPETCNGVDDDCNGTIDDDSAVDAVLWYADADADGHGDAAVTFAACAAPVGYVADADDCDDASSQRAPGLAEVCDDLDNDCNGSTDDAATDAVTSYTDADGDGYGDATTASAACDVPAGNVLDATDCDDAAVDTNPGADEVCGGGDENCDGTVDEDSAADAPTWYADADADGYGDAALTDLACAAPTGYVSDATDCDDTTSATNPGAQEFCGGADENCDGTVDEDSAADAATWYADLDADGFSTLDSTMSCEAPAGFIAASATLDCDDTDAATNPAALELCGGEDENCDGTVDEDSAADALTWYADADADGFTTLASTVACDAPAGYAAASGMADCDDTRALVNPDGTEVCGGGDENCDGAVDEATAADAARWYADLDADAFGDASASLAACVAPTGYVADASDCDDADALTSPAGTEVCGGSDENCDGNVDESTAADAPTWYADADLDTFGDIGASLASCTAPTGYVSDATDCDDDAAATNPAADEVCGGADENCDGAVDETTAVDALSWYSDTDADGFGNASAISTACDAPAGTVADASDCDDAQGSTYPGAPETCDSRDNDCDGLVDDADAGRVGGTIWYADADADGYTTSTSTMTCLVPAGYRSASALPDCDDASSAVNPGASEVCDNGVDDNCSDTPDNCEISDAPTTATALAAASDSPPHATSRAGASWYGTLASDGVGSGVANVGDMNGDGKDDVFLSAYQFDTAAGTDVGRAWLWSGAAASGNTSLTTSTASAGLLATISGVRRNSSPDYLGIQISRGGNFGGAGTLSVVVGASNTRTGASSSGPGAAGEAMVFVDPAGALDRTAAAARLRVLGTVASDFVGYDVSGGLDVNDDGLADVLVGGYGYDVTSPTAATNAGAAGVYFGGTSGDVNFASANAFFTGAAASDQAGQVLAMVPDVNGDGLGEVVVCAYKADTSVIDAGKAYVIYGDAAFAGGSLGSSSVVDVTISGPTTGTYTTTFPEFCRSVGDGGGDYDGDGTNDLWIGGHQVTTTVGASTYNFAGAAYLFTGSSTGLAAASMSIADARTTLQGIEASMYFGRSIATGGDFNGDGMDDVVVGASSADTPASNAGGAFGWYGGLSEGTWSIASADFFLTGERANDAFGGNVSFVGDTDDDGFDDLVVSAVNWEPSGSAVTSVGNVWLLRGRGE